MTVSREDWLAALARDERCLAHLLGCVEDGWLPQNMTPGGLRGSIIGLRLSIANKRALLAAMPRLPGGVS